MKKNNNINSIPWQTNLLLNIIFVIYALFCIVPLLLVTVVSITDENVLVISGYSLLPSKLSFKAYEYLMLMGNTLIRAYGVTIFVSVAGSMLSLLVVALYAYPLSRKDFRYGNQFSFILFFTMLFNGGMVPWYLVCTQVLHLRNTIWALIVPYLVNAFYIIIMKTFYKMTIPETVIEAAKIDGAGEFRIFFKIVFPLAIPGLATIALFSMLAFWNDWWLPLMFIDDNKFINLQFLLYSVQQKIEFLATASGTTMSRDLIAPSETARMALCIAAVGPIIFAYPFFQRYFVKGLVIGAIKG